VLLPEPAVMDPYAYGAAFAALLLRILIAAGPAQESGQHTSFSGRAMHKIFIRTLLIVAGATMTAAVHAKDFEVLQKDKKFSQKSLTVKVGDTVSFRNEDPFMHNILSLSDTKTFDLGSYPQGQSRSVTFDKPGTVEVECAIHPEMKMVVEVKK
jgi:plastocyanin